jgi:CheY-like chemotaxis protein
MPERTTILLVEDEIFTRRMMQIYFENDGYHVEQAGSAREALAILETKAVDLVLSDIMMPEISGLELLRRIREKYSKEALPVILVTGLDDSKQILQAIALGANDFMVKTKEFRIVLARVALHLDWKRLKQKAEEKIKDSTDINTPGGAWRWNLKGGEVFYSDAWKALLGYGPHHLEPRLDEWFSRIHPDDFANVSQEIANHQKCQTDQFEAVFRMLNAAQEYVWVRAFGVVILDAKQQPAWMAGGMWNIHASGT